VETIAPLIPNTSAIADEVDFDLSMMKSVDLTKHFVNHTTKQLTAQVNLLSDLLVESGVNRKDQPFELAAIKADFISDTLPDTPLSADQYAQRLHQLLGDKTINVASPKFIGHMTSKLPNFHAAVSLLVNGLNQNMVKVETSGALTFMERQLTAMLHSLFYPTQHNDCKQMLEDSSSVFGIVTSGGSVSNVSSLTLARNKALTAKGCSIEDIRQRGATELINELGYRRAVIISTSLSHYSIKKTASLLGFGQNNVRYVDAMLDAEQQSEKLQQMLADCEQNRELVIAIIGVAGATETGNIDPLNALGEIARHHGIHFHVDAAWGGAFQFSPQLKDRIKGIEKADSITLCPHKQLYMPQGISLCLFKNVNDAHLIATHAVYQAKEGSFDLGQYSIEGSRPANCLHLHAGLHLMTAKGYADLMERNIELTTEFCLLLDEMEEFEICRQPDLNIVNYRYIPRSLHKSGGPGKSGYSKSDNRQISRAVGVIHQKQFANGEGFVSTTDIKIANNGDERWSVFRAVLCNPTTRFSDLKAVLLEQTAIAHTEWEQSSRVDSELAQA
jgi:putative pyridoxal-dependent aspartate 1-decarboxylase